MIALLLAAQVAAASPMTVKPAQDPFAALALEGVLERRQALSRFGGATDVQAWQRGACGPSPVQPVAVSDAAAARKLGDLPKAHHEIAVLRTEGGCPKPVIVRYNVGR